MARLRIDMLENLQRSPNPYLGFGVRSMPWRMGKGRKGMEKEERASEGWKRKEGAPL